MLVKVFVTMPAVSKTRSTAHSSKNVALLVSPVSVALGTADSVN